MANTKKTALRELAARDWFPCEDSPNLRELQLGALQRISHQLEQATAGLGALGKEISEKLESIDSRLWELKVAVEGGAPAAAAADGGDEAGEVPASGESAATSDPLNGTTTRALVEAACVARGLTARKGKLRTAAAVDAWMATNGRRGDPQRASAWRIVAAAAKGKVKGFGAARRKALEAWIAASFEETGA